MRWILAATFLALNACAPEADVLEGDISQAQLGEKDLSAPPTLTMSTVARNCDQVPKPKGCPGSKDFSSSGSGNPTVHGDPTAIVTKGGTTWLTLEEDGSVSISFDKGRTTAGYIDGAAEFKEFTVGELEDGSLLLGGVDAYGAEFAIGSLGAYAVEAEAQAEKP